MGKVRGIKIAEFNHGGATLAVVKMADPEEGEFVTPGSDQADAVLRLEGISKLLSCPVERIEENIVILLSTDSLHPDPEHVVEATPDTLTEVLQAAEDMGFEVALVVGDISEFEELLK
jgi:hypothetical protein